MFAYRVVIIFRIILQADEFGHVLVPHQRVFPVLLCQFLGIIDVPDSGIVGSQCEFDLLFRVCDFTESLAETAQTFNACPDTGIRVFQFVRRYT